MSLAGRWRAWCVKCGSWHGPGLVVARFRPVHPATQVRAWDCDTPCSGCFDATAVDGGMWRLADGRLTAGGLGRDPRDHPRSLLA